MALIEMKTATITSKRQIALPSSLSETEGFREGQQVAVLTYEDRMEIRPLKVVEKKIDWEAENKKTRAALKHIVDKHGLRGKKIRMPTKKERNQWAKEYLEQIERDQNKK